MSHHNWKVPTHAPLICPGCGNYFEIPPWQAVDGPCFDGKWYCLPCIRGDKCGCEKPQKLEVKDVNPN